MFAWSQDANCWTHLSGMTEVSLVQYPPINLCDVPYEKKDSHPAVHRRVKQQVPPFVRQKRSLEFVLIPNL